MKHYELTYLISPDLSEEEANSLSEKIILLVSEKQGILEKATSILKKQLAYPIQKKETAYLASFNFQIKIEKLKELESQIKSNSKILRYLILTTIKIKSDFKKIKSFSKVGLNKKDDFSLSLKKTKEITPKGKVELKKIEEKLEEILQ